jgi:hypothetical protein
MRSYLCNGLILDTVVKILLEYTPLATVHASLGLESRIYSYVQMTCQAEAVSVLYGVSVKNIFRGAMGHND